MKISQEGLRVREAKIAMIEKRLNELEREYAASDKRYRDDNLPNPVSETFNQEIAFLSSLLKDEKTQVQSAEILSDDLLSDDTITLGDKVTILMQFNDEPAEEMETILTDNVEVHDPSMVTIESPIGKAIYLQKVGAEVMCDVPVGTLKITILSKTKSMGR